MLHQLAIEAVLKWALRKRAAERIPRSGAAGEAVDCMVPHLLHEATDTEILIDVISERGFLGRLWTGNAFDLPCSVPKSALTQQTIKIHRFYGLDNYIYVGLPDFLFNEITLMPLRHYISDKISQRFFNSRTPARTSRIVALRALIDDRISRASENGGHVPHGYQGRSIIGLMDQIHGRRIYRHPSYPSVAAELQLILDSLVESDDLRCEDSQYCVLGKSLSTLAHYEEDNRRNRTNVRLTWAMVILTFCLVIVGVLDAMNGFTAAGPP